MSGAGGGALPYERLKAMFLMVRELPEEERASALAASCEGDPELQAEVARLLRAEASACFLEPSNPVLASAAEGVWRELAGFDADESSVPARIGRYEILGLIAHGGMAAVYRARQEHPERTVAIKLIRPGPGSSALLPRLEREARLLGRLQHPGIAQVFDAGRVDTGFGKLPFLVMELVDGMPLDVGAELRGLDLRQRLGLVIEACEAVEHAHQRGVIHRDLKPANVLLTADGHVKVLDFGVARLLDSEAPGATSHTADGQLLGTLRYMSPEQASGNPDEIDTRSDVYGLGVLAYELLTGRSAHAIDRLSFADAVSVVREHEPARIGQFDPALRGDLEIIVAKAMAKDKERRYASASELGADFRRVLANEPILARSPSTIYLIRTFARRHRGPVVGAVAAAIVVVCAGSFATWQAIERSREAARLREVNAFWNDLFESPDPSASSFGANGGLQVTVVEYLEQASGRLGAAYAQQPAVEAALRTTIGRTLLALELPERALGELTRADELRTRRFGPRDPRTLAERRFIADAYAAMQQTDEAERILRSTLADLESVAGARDPDTIECEVGLASLMFFGRGDVVAGAEIAADAVARVRRAGLERSPAGVAALSTQAFVLMRQSRHDEAAKFLAEALAALDEIAEPADADRLSLMTTLAELEWRRGNPDRSAALLGEIIAARTERYGASHGSTLDVKASLGQVLASMGDDEQGIALMDEVLAVLAAAQPGNEGAILETKFNLGRLLYSAGQYDRGIQMNQEAFEGSRRAQGPDGIMTLISLNHLALCLQNSGRLEEAGWRFDDLRERVDRVFADAPDGSSAALRCSMGRFYMAVGRYQDAETQLLRAYETGSRMQNAVVARTVAEALADLYTRWERPEDAASWAELAEPE